MAVALTSKERERLAKMAGMLGSSSEGERLNALSLITRMADQKKVRVDELLLSGQTEVVREVVRWVEQPQHRQDEPFFAEPPNNWQEQLLKAVEVDRSQPFLTEWEVSFCSDIASRKTKMVTAKQAAIIERIIKKLDAKTRSRESTE